MISGTSPGGLTELHNPNEPKKAVGIDHARQESQRSAIIDLLEEQVYLTKDFEPESEVMANPHIGTARAVVNDIHKNGWTPKKGKLAQGALKRAVHHREGDKSRGRKGY